MIDNCDKCKKVTNIHEHHLLPKARNNPHGYNIKGYPSRVWLCPECHLGKQGIHNFIRTLGKVSDEELVKKCWEWVHG
jgi:hypothetical protein